MDAVKIVMGVLVLFIIVAYVVSISDAQQTYPLSTYTGSISQIGGSGCNSADLKLTGVNQGMVVLVSPRSYPGPFVVWHGYVKSNGLVTVETCAMMGTAQAVGYNVRVLQ